MCVILSSNKQVLVYIRRKNLEKRKYAIKTSIIPSMILIKYNKISTNKYIHRKHSFTTCLHHLNKRQT